MKKGKMMRKFAAFIVCAALLCGTTTAMVFAAEAPKEFAFSPFTETSFTNFQWGSSMTKELSQEYSKTEGPSLKIVKSEALENSGAAVYYQNFGSNVSAMQMENNTGVSFWIYLDTAMENSSIDVKFKGSTASSVKSQTEGGEVEDSASLNFTGFKKFIAEYPAEEDFDPTTKSELEICLLGSDNGTAFLSALCAVYTGNASGDSEPKPPVYEELGAEKLQISGFNTAEDLSAWNISGASGTTYSKQLNTDDSKISEGAGSLKYTFKNELYGFGWTEIYLDVTKLIEHNKAAGLKGISFSLENIIGNPVGKVGFWVKLAEADGSEYEVDAGLIKTGTKLDFKERKTIEVPFSAATILQDYTTDENSVFDADQLAFIKIGIWSNHADIVNVEMYIDNLMLTADRELSVPPAGGGSDEDNNGDGGDNDKINESKIDTWVWVLIGVGSAVLLAGGGLILYFFVFRKKK